MRTKPNYLAAQYRARMTRYQNDKLKPLLVQRVAENANYRPYCVSCCYLKRMDLVDSLFYCSGCGVYHSKTLMVVTPNKLVFRKAG